MSEPTIRALLERIRDTNEVWGQDDPDVPCCHCWGDVQQTHQDAVAALALLNNADRYGGIYNRRAFDARCRLVPDQEEPS